MENSIEWYWVVSGALGVALIAELIRWLIIRRRMKKQRFEQQKNELDNAIKEWLAYV